MVGAEGSAELVASLYTTALDFASLESSQSVVTAEDLCKAA